MSTFVIGDLHGRRAQLRALVSMLPRDPAADTLVLLGDLVDRGTEIPGAVEDVIALRRESPERTVCLRGNHEQMLLDFLDEGATIWLHAAVGGHNTIHQYTGDWVRIRSEKDFHTLRRRVAESIPEDHVEFFRSLPLYHEDDYALYVHAGLEGDKHPRDTDPQHLLWSRDPAFYKSYAGKPCVFGHTPTPLLPLRGRLGHHGIYMLNSAVGIDTGYVDTSPLTCLQLPELTLYQAFADGRTATHQLSAFLPEPLRAMQRRHATRPDDAPAEA
ncbi:MAG: serine/threonine protein phosphatase [Acidobacteria bacterium]|nr:serine/threonine protein phosphatase [Acidobacteriota bacterium]